MKQLLAMIAATSVLALGFAISPLAAGHAQAAGCVQIYRIYFDSPGSDSGSNASRNAEWIQLKNKCATAKTITGWKIADASGHVYRFGTFTLKAGRYVKVHTGTGTNTSTDRYWGSRYYIWNNNGDTAKLRSSTSVLLDSCKYTGAGSAVYC
jgi:hypothetical protein